VALFLALGILFSLAMRVTLALPSFTLEKSAPTSAMAGTPFTYVITITNTSSEDAIGVVVTDRLPSNVQLVGGTISDGGVYASGVVSWSIDIPKGSTAVRSFQVLATQAGTVVNADYRATYDVVLVLGSGASTQVTAGPPDRAIVEANPATLTADGISTAAITVTVEDAYGNPVADGTSVNVTASAGTLSGFGTTVNGQVYGLLTAPTTVGQSVISVQNLNTQDATITLVPGPPAKATIDANPNQLVADGSSTSLLTITVRDAYDNLVADGTSVTVNTTAGTINGSSTTVNGLVTRQLVASTSIATATLSIDGVTVSGDTAIPFTVGPPASATVVASPTTVTADGADAAVLTITLKDSGGHLVADGTGATVTTTLGTVSGSGTTVNGVLTRTLTSTAIGTATIGVVGVDTTGDTVTFVAGPLDHVTVTPHGTVYVPVDEPQQFTAQGEDAYNNPIDGLTYSWTFDIGGDGGGIIDSSGLFTGTALGTVYVVATANGVSSAAVSVRVIPGSPAQASVVASPQQIVADNTDQSLLLITIRDIQGNLVSDGTTPTVTSTMGTILGVDGTVNGVAQRALRAGTSVGEAHFYVNGFAATGDTVTLVAGPPAKADIVANPASIPANGVATTTLTITLWDQYDNLVADGSSTVLVTDDGTLHGCDTATTVSGVMTCTLQSSTNIGTATVQAPALQSTGGQVDFVVGQLDHIVVTPSEDQTVAAGQTLHFAAQGYDSYEVPIPNLTYVWTKFRQDGDGEIDSSGNFVGGTAGKVYVRASVDQVFSNLVTVNVVAGDPAQAEVQANPATIVADGVSTSTLTVTVRDNYGNLVADGTPVAVYSSLGSVAGSGNTVNGVVTRTLHAGTAAGTATISVSGATTSGDTVRLTAGPPASAVVVANPTQLVADGASTSQLTITLRDAFGNLVEDGTVVTVTADLGAVSGSAGTTDGVMVRTFTAGTALGTAHIDVGGLPTSGGSVYLIPGDPDHAVVHADPTSVVADGSSMSTLTIEILDAMDHEVTSGIPVTVTSSLGTVEGTGSTVGGQVVRYLQAGTDLGSAVLSVEVPGGVLPVFGDTVRFVVGPASKAIVDAAPTEIPADGASMSVLTITAMDNYSHTVPDGTVLTVTTDIGSISGTGATQNGAISRVFHAGTVAGTVQLAIASDGGALAVGGDTLVVAPGPLDQMNVTPSSPPDVQSGESYTFTLIATDAYSNVISSLPVQWLLTQETGTGSITPINGGMGAVFTAVKPGTLRIQAQSGSTYSNMVILTVIAGPPARAHIQASPTTITANGTDRAYLTITVTDAHDNPVGSGLPVTVTTNLGVVGGSGNTVDGVASRYLTSTVAGVAHLQAGDLVPVGDITITLEAGPPTQAVVTAEPAQLIADGVSTSTLTISVEDSFGNLVGDGVPVAVSTSLGTLTGSGNTVGGTTTRTLRSSTTVGTANIVVTGLTTIGGQVDFVPGPPSSATVQAWPLEVEANGVDTSTLSITLRDAWGHLVADGTNVVITSTVGQVLGDTSTTSGVLTRTLRSSTAGLAHIGSPGLTLVGDDVLFVPGPASTAEIIATPKTLPADGNSTALLTIVVRDGQGNLVHDGTPLSVHSSIGELYGTGASVGGVLTRTLVSTVAGTAIITADGATTTGDNVIIFTPGPPTQAEVRAWPRQLVADGVSTGVLTVTVRDGLGNLVADDTPINLDSSLGMVLGTSTTKNGVVTRTLRADLNLGTATFEAEGIGQATGDQVAFVPGPPAKAWITADPNHLPADGVSTSLLHVSITDPWDHPVTDGLDFIVTTTLGVLTGDTPSSGGEITRTLRSTMTIGTAYLDVVGLTTGGQTAIPIQDMLLNGDFEAGDSRDWIVGGELPVTVTAGDLFVAQPFAGQDMVRLGPPSLRNEGHPVGSAWMYQPFHVPEGVPATLSLWYRMFSYDVLTGIRFPLWDSFDLTLRDSDGSPIKLIQRVGYQGQYQGQLWDSGWRRFLFDLTPWAGQQIQLHMELANRNEPVDDSWVYVDNIELLLQPLYRLNLPAVFANYGGAYGSESSLTLVPGRGSSK
jgi:adhesin/invasin